MTGRSRAVIVSVLLAVTRARGAKIDWPTYGGGVQRTGENAAESALGPGSVSGLTQRWVTDVGGVIVASPVLAADVSVGGVATDLLYIGTEHGLLTALDAATGRIVWSRNLGTQSTTCDDSPDGIFGVTDTPALDRASQSVYVAGGDGRLYALDWATGATRAGWPIVVTTDPAHEHVWGAVTLANGKLYVETASFCDATPYYGRVTQIDPATHAASSWYVTAPPNMGPGGGGIWGWGGASVDATGDLYVATGNATTTPESYGYAERVVRLTSALAVRSSNYPGLTGFDVDFGTTPVPVQAPGCPAQLVVENKSGVLFLYDRDAIGSGPVQSIAIADYVDGGELIGVPAYRAATQTVYVSNPTDRTGAIFRHGMLAFTLGTDCLLHLGWQHAMGLNAAVVSPPTVANGVVYYGDGPGNQAVALDASTGALLWTSGTAIADGIYAPPVVANGWVFVGAWDHAVHAFSLTSGAPANATPPTITGPPQQGQTLTASLGTWSGGPTSFAYAWTTCDASGAACVPIAGAMQTSYTPQSTDVGHTLRVVVTAANGAGSASATSAPTALVQAASPSGTVGFAQIGATTCGGGANYLDATGPWTTGGGSLAKLTGRIAGGAASQRVRAVVYADAGGRPGALVAVTPEVAIAAGQAAAWVDFTLPTLVAIPSGRYWLGYWYGSTSNAARFACTNGVAGIERYVADPYASVGRPNDPWAAGGASTSEYSLYATIATATAAPQNTAPPTVAGTAQQGQTLTASPGSWSGSPTSFAYAWRDCDTTGAACTTIPGAAQASYMLQASDVGHALRVVVTATNAVGSTAATSAPTAVVQAASTTTIGFTQIGATTCAGGASYLDATGPWTVSSTSSLAKLTGRIAGGTASQRVRGVVYADASGNPGALVAATPEVTIGAGQAAAWIDFPLAAPVTIGAGRYWIGYWYGPTSNAASFACTNGVAGIERYVADPYSSTGQPSTTWGTGGASTSEYSLYATLGPASAPQNTSPPTIAGTAQQGQPLTASAGTWSGSPTSFAYAWRQCDTNGGTCTAITAAAQASYVVQASDVGHTIRVSVTATNAVGSSGAMSAPTSVVQAAQGGGTFGFSQIGATTCAGGANYLDATGPWAVSSPVTLTKLTGRVTGGTASQRVRGVVYAEASGSPGALVAVTPEVTIAAGQSAAWIDLPFAGGVALPAARYWIGYWYGGTSNAARFACTNGVAGIERYVPAPYSSTGRPNDPWGTGPSSTSEYSLYATFTGG